MRLRIRQPSALFWSLAVALGALLSSPASACTGDCNRDDRVAIDELITGVNIALEVTSSEVCSPLDEDADMRVVVNELVAAVDNGLSGCPALRIAGGAVTVLRAVLDPQTTGGLPRNEATERQLSSGEFPAVDFFVPAQLGAWTSAAILSHALRERRSEFRSGFSTDELLAYADAIVGAVERILEHHAFTDPVTGGKALYQVHYTPTGEAPRGSPFERTISLLDNAALITGLDVASLYLQRLDPTLAARIDALLARFNLSMWVVGNAMRIGAQGTEDPRTGPMLDRIVSEGRLAAVAARARGEIDAGTFASIVQSMIAQSRSGASETGLTIEYLPYVGTALEVWSATPYLSDELGSRLGSGTLIPLVSAWEEVRARLRLPAAGATGIADGFGHFLEFAWSPSENRDNPFLDQHVLVPPAAGIQAGAVGAIEPLALKNLERVLRAASQSRRLHPAFGVPNYLDFGTGLVNEGNPVWGTLEIAQMAVALLNHLLGDELRDLLGARPGWGGALEEYVNLLNASAP